MWLVSLFFCLFLISFYVWGNDFESICILFRTHSEWLTHSHSQLFSFFPLKLFSVLPSNSFSIHTGFSNNPMALMLNSIDFYFSRLLSIFFLFWFHRWMDSRYVHCLQIWCCCFFFLLFFHSYFAVLSMKRIEKKNHDKESTTTSNDFGFVYLFGFYYCFVFIGHYLTGKMVNK